MEKWLEKIGLDPHKPHKPKTTWPFHNAMHIAARAGNAKALRWLGEMSDIDVNAPDWHGSTPAHLACENGHLEALKWIVKNGGAKSLKRENRYGSTPTQIAIVNSHVGICQWIDETGLLLPQQQRKRRSPKKKR